MIFDALENAEEYLTWAQEHELYSAVLTFTALVVVNTFCIPLAGVVMTSAGFLLKEIKGFIVMYFAYNIAAWVGFSIGRFVLRKFVQRWTSSMLIMKALSNAVQKRGWKLVFLLQLPPTGVPSPLLNYCVGSITKLPFPEYVWGTAVGSPLHVFCYVYLGSLLSSVEDLINGKAHTHSSVYYVSNAIGVFMSVFVTIYAIQITRKEVEIIRQAQRKDDPVVNETLV